MEGKLCCCSRPFSDDYDYFNPCFFDEVETEEEFYDAPAPSEDIWKKFELLPTPPRSPKHETSYPGVMNSTLEKLQMVSDALEPITLSAEFSMFPEDCAVCSQDTFLTSVALGLDSEDKELCQSLKSNLIQDCMWSGNTGLQCLGDGKGKDDTLASGSLSNADVAVSTTVCVSPQSVFPFPLNDRENVNVSSLEIETPSDSDDDDEEEEDDDEEDQDEDVEIDVVSVNERTAVSDHRYTVSIVPVIQSPASAHVAAIHNYSASQPCSPAKSDSLPASPAHSHTQSRKRQRSHVGRPAKRARLTLHLSNSDRIKVNRGRYSTASSRSSSDSEDGADGNKRSQHNILERKRRNDLKYSFHILRDHVPELSTQERAPKVVILKKATDFIHQLRRSSQALQSEHDRLKRRQEQLRQKLKLLQSQ